MNIFIGIYFNKMDPETSSGCHKVYSILTKVRIHLSHKNDRFCFKNSINQIAKVMVLLELLYKTLSSFTQRAQWNRKGFSCFGKIELKRYSKLSTLELEAFIYVLRLLRTLCNYRFLRVLTLPSSPFGLRRTR